MCLWYSMTKPLVDVTVHFKGITTDQMWTSWHCSLSVLWADGVMMWFRPSGPRLLSALNAAGRRRLLLPWLQLTSDWSLDGPAWRPEDLHQGGAALWRFLIQPPAITTDLTPWIIGWVWIPKFQSSMWLWLTPELVPASCRWTPTTTSSLTSSPHTHVKVAEARAGKTYCPHFSCFSSGMFEVLTPSSERVESCEFFWKPLIFVSVGCIYFHLWEYP